MKKFKLLILSLIFILSLLSAVACGGNPSTDDGGGDLPTPPVTPSGPVITNEEGTKGLEYKVERTNKGVKYAVCTGIGTATDTNIVIASHYDGVLVREISQAAFKGNTNIKSVKMVNAMEKIDFYAFQNCTSLESVTLPETLTKISQNAFDGCELLLNVCNDSSIDIRKGDTGHGSVANYACNIYSSKSGSPGVYKTEGEFDIFLFGSNRVVLKYKGLSSEVTFPENTTGIYKDAFKGNTKITEITIPASVTYIGKTAFANCTSLKEITFADGSQIADIGANAFVGCEALETFNYNNTIENYINIVFADDLANPLYYTKGIQFYGETLDKIVIPNTITKIRGCLFVYCSNIKSISIPASVTEIEPFAFAYSQVEEITFAPNSNLQIIGSNSFAYNDALKQITIPKSVEKVGIQAFTECNALESVVFENDNKCEILEEKAFYHCSALKYFHMGHNSALTELAEYCFYQCRKLEVFKFGNNSKIRFIRASAFRECKPLKELYIPATCVYIGAWTFSGCFQHRGTPGMNLYVDHPSKPLDWNENFNSSPEVTIYWGTPYPTE